MATRPTTKKPVRRPLTAAKAVEFFQQWLGIKDEVGTLSARQTELRDELRDAIPELGYEDEKGHWWFDLPETIEYTDAKGKVFHYNTLKRQRSLTPAQPTPDPVKAEEYLREKGLWWVEPKDEVRLERIQDRNKYVRITVEVDVDALARAYFERRISEEEYDALLIEQRENFSFVPAELAEG